MILAVGLILQAVAVSLLFGRLRSRALSRLGAIFVLMAVLYHGVGELLVRFFPGRDRYRLALSPSPVNNFVLWISIAILVLTLVYLATLGTSATQKQDDKASGARTASFYKLTIVAPIAVLLTFLTASGHGAQAPTQFGVAASQTTLEVLVGGLLFITLGLFAVAVVNTLGPRLALPVLLVVVLISSLTGQRGNLLSIVLVLYALRRHTDARLRKRIVFGSVVLVLFVSVVLTSARASVGRDPFSAGQSFGSRYEAFAAGLGHITAPGTINSIKDTLGSRLDGNSFGALEMVAINGGAQPLHLEEFRLDVGLAIPSFLNPAKLSGDISRRVPKLNAERHFFLPETDILATQLGGLTGWFGIPGLIVIAGSLGFGLARLDRWVVMKYTPSRIFVSIGALDAFVQYERGIEAWLIEARVIVIGGPAIATLSLVGRALRARYRNRPVQVSPIGSTRRPSSVIPPPDASFVPEEVSSPS